MGVDDEDEDEVEERMKDEDEDEMDEDLDLDEILKELDGTCTMKMKMMLKRE